MAIPYDIKDIETKLKTFTSKSEKLKYLIDYVFELRKQEAEFVAFDNNTLIRLREKTKEDHDRYMNFIDNGGITYFNSTFDQKTGRYDLHKYDLNFAQKHGIKDLNLLLIRLKLENPILELQGRIKLFESLIERENALPTQQSENTLIPQQDETKTEPKISKKFIANEYALAYIYDLYASGKQIPVNRIDGGLDKKELIKKGFELYQFDNKKDTFYRAVKRVATFDLNKQQELLNISQSWIEAVKALSKDWNKTEKYLKEKELIRE